MNPTVTLIVCIVFMIIWALSQITECVYSQSFWWNTDRGNNYCSASLYRIPILNIYWISFDENGYGTPTEHPNYEDFLKKVKEIKNKP